MDLAMLIFEVLSVLLEMVCLQMMLSLPNEILSLKANYGKPQEFWKPSMLIAAYI